MNFLSRESRPGVSRRAGSETNISHELTEFDADDFAKANRPLRNLERRPTMQWQKPQATDLRYGFEITMYISAR